MDVTVGNGSSTAHTGPTPLLSEGDTPPRSRQHSGPYLTLLAWASNYGWAGASADGTQTRSHEFEHERRFSLRVLPMVSHRWEMKDLTSHSRFDGRFFKASRHIRKSLRGAHDVARIDVIEEVAPNAREVHGPRGPHLGHTPRSEFRDVASCVGGTGGLRHEATRFELGHQASRPARRQVSRAREVRHSQLTIRGFREMHDRCVLARRQSHASDEVTVEESWQYFEYSHLSTPERIFVWSERFDGGHSHYFNLLRQATWLHREATATAAFRNHFLNRHRKTGTEYAK